MYSPETGYVWDLPMEPVTQLDKSGKDLAGAKLDLTEHVRSRSRTCPLNDTRIWQRTRISLKC
jgi:hypothetical protein